MIYFTSDTHYNHKNIVRGTTSWEIDKDEKGSHQNLRDFDTLEEHNQKLVDNINSVVKENDELYHLGDWSFGGKQNILIFREQIKCKNIHIIFGNHDHHIENDGIIRNIAFKSYGYYKEIKYNKYNFILCHYAMRVWNKSHHGSIMLYGHSHGTLDEMTPEIANPTWIGDKYYIKNYRTMDVGVDTNNLFPYSIEDIIRIMNKRDVALEIDHHNKNTN